MKILKKVLCPQIFDFVRVYANLISVKMYSGTWVWIQWLMFSWYLCSCAFCIHCHNSSLLMVINMVDEQKKSHDWNGCIGSLKNARKSHTIVGFQKWQDQCRSYCFACRVGTKLLFFFDNMVSPVQKMSLVIHVVLICDVL